MSDPAAARLADRAAALSEEILRRVADLVDGLRAAGGAAWGVGSSLPGMVVDTVSSVQRLAEEVPTPTAQLELLVQEIRAKRAMVGAMQAQMAAFDRELDILESSLRPLQTWAAQWAKVQDSLLDLSRALADRRPAEPGGPGATARRTS